MFSIQFSEDPKKRKAERIFLYVGGGAILVVVICLVLGLLIELLWNSTIAAMFGLPAISYWQAIGLFILAKFFFGFGTSGSSGRRSSGRKKSHDQRQSEHSEDISNLADDEAFRKYWQEEGKASYDAFSTTRRDEDR